MATVSQTVLEGLNTAIQAELAAYVFYMKGRKLTKNDKLKELLGQLAGEEKEHYKVLERQYDGLVRSEMWVAYNDIMRKPGLPDLDEKMEDVHNDYIDELSAQTTPRRILDIALGLEKRARDMYASMVGKVDDPRGKEMFNYLSKFENGHVIKIEQMIAQFK